MLTIDDIREVPLFSTLAESELDHLAHTCADLHLCTGEFAVHEGGERALYAVLSGRMEVIKTFDGIERTLGWRLPGTIFGEVPLALSSPFPGAYRAAEPSRVMRVEAQQYYMLAAKSPDVALKMGALARERIGGLQGLSAEAPTPRVTMVGNRWDTSCTALRHFLSRNQISYDWMTPDAPELSSRWPQPCPSEAECPALRLVDGTVLNRPATRELAELLGLQTKPRRAEYDTLIIGGGPAGLAAAVYGASEGLSTIVVEREAPGGQAGTSSRIENYLGFPNGVSGDELASRALQQARRLGAEILVTRQVSQIDVEHRTVHLDGDDAIRARTIILATGVAWRRLAIDGFDRFIGKGIYYGASRSEASATHGLDVYLIGGGNSAGQAALYFANHARMVTLVLRGDSLEKSMSRYLVEQLHGKTNVAVRLRSEVVGAQGDAHLAAIDIRDALADEVHTHDCAGLFVFIGADAETEWLPAAIARDDRGYVITGDDVVRAGRWSQDRDPYLLESSVPGVFACGDVRLSPVKRVASAVGEGSMAIAFAHKFLQQA
ncbi:FAD-dependent oxidoreductase [Paraburkholderia phymatum]|uniref:Cyclic nucleotide-regulated FAD-dependent pyridine nucleotide-disulphide oxidoreductase n=1 Tax=Paraburkholderia phymatum (strain DSM 17167 / CIP 108236 / LMG 21445 / STM815) TaxID=391038 RepID=B2JR18_PARP8|nr:cyclic nucleotide-binding domain-containing thioredoxin-disulfide reductase [Paraburkholderia phymatum]ACC73709.1 cyclic nucleotide-regulated FAD-dependent pyridine nucleotide-disulphide oxidoreductase [Paraburkholderia phymatum STM815]